MRLMFYIILYTGMACAMDDPATPFELTDSSHLTDFTAALNRHGNYIQDPNDDGQNDYHPAHQPLLDQPQQSAHIPWHIHLLACFFCLDARQLAFK